MPHILLFLALLACARFAAAAQSLEGYTWQEVSGGIYLHSRTDPLAGPVDGNSVVILTGEGVVVVHTHINPAAARAVIARIRALTGQPVTHIVNTHWHDDHTNGNQAFRTAFPGARIVAHQATLAALQREWEPMEAQRREAYAALSAEQVLARADTLEATDPHRAITYRIYAGYLRALKPELPGMEPIYPDTPFERELVIEQGGRRIEIRWPGRGNTEGDAIAWLPKERVMITGDLLVWPIPFAFDSPMGDWARTLDGLAALQPSLLIPGHGPVLGDTAYLRQVQALLRATVQAVERARRDGIDFPGLAGAVDLGRYEAQFTAGDPMRRHAWRTYFLEPGLKSAWTALGYPLPEQE